MAKWKLGKKEIAELRRKHPQLAERLGLSYDDPHKEADEIRRILNNENSTNEEIEQAFRRYERLVK